MSGPAVEATSAASDSSGHIPVLSEPLERLLDPRPGETVLDCTVGRGGHTLLLARRTGSAGRVLGMDLDAGNLEFARARLRGEGVEAELVHGSFRLAAPLLRQRGLRCDVVLADLGFASTQIDDPERGLSFTGSGPLDMRYDRSEGRTASELLATLREGEIAELIRKLGEEPLAERIARAIVQQRRRAPITTTQELADLVRGVYGPRARHSRLHPATRTFMALRIAVNDELNALAALLEEIAAAAERIGAGGDAWLAPGARIGIISFHSLEDRLVKHAFAALEARGLAERAVRRPVIADEAELARNPRARSAKLRVLRLPRSRDERPLREANSPPTGRYS